MSGVCDGRRVKREYEWDVSEGFWQGIIWWTSSSCFRPISPVLLLLLILSRTMWESRISRYANYHAHIELDGVKHDVHFAGLFSEKKDAGGLVMVHGWPGEWIIAPLDG